MKSRLKSYFSVTKKEWNGMVVLVILITVALLAPYFYDRMHKNKTIDEKQFNEAIARLNQASPAANNATDTKTIQDTSRTLAGYHQKPFVVIELNSADSATLTQMRGIGPAFAMRILHYRQRLGGFRHKEQLKEVFGVDEKKYDQFKTECIVNTRLIKKININTVTFEGLKNNPYLNFKQANAIIMYRKEHGNYETLAEMKNIAILDNEILRKLAPYLVFN